MNCSNKPFNPTPNLSLRYAHGWRHFMRSTSLPVGRGLTERYAYLKMKKRFLTLTMILLAPTLNSEEINDCPADILKEVVELPKYPTDIKFGTEGWVELEALLASDGKLRDIKAVAAEPLGVFERSAIKSARTWTFNWEGSFCRYKKRITFELE